MTPEQFVFYLRGLLICAHNKGTDGLSAAMTANLLDALEIVEPRLPTESHADDCGDVSDRIAPAKT